MSAFPLTVSRAHTSEQTYTHTHTCTQTLPSNSHFPLNLLTNSHHTTHATLSHHTVPFLITPHPLTPHHTHHSPSLPLQLKHWWLLLSSCSWFWGRGWLGSIAGLDDRGGLQCGVLVGLHLIGHLFQACTRGGGGGVGGDMDQRIEGGSRWIRGESMRINCYLEKNHSHQNAWHTTSHPFR